MAKVYGIDLRMYVFGIVVRAVYTVVHAVSRLTNDEIKWDENVDGKAQANHTRNTEEK